MSKLNGSVLIRQVTFGALLKHGGHGEMDCETASLKGHLEHQLGYLGVRSVGVLQLGECGL